MVFASLSEERVTLITLVHRDDRLIAEEVGDCVREFIELNLGLAASTEPTPAVRVRFVIAKFGLLLGMEPVLDDLYITGDELRLPSLVVILCGHL